MFSINSLASMFGRVHLALSPDIPEGIDLNSSCVCIDDFCAGNYLGEFFGPANLSKIFDFCQMLEKQTLISKLPIVLHISVDEKIISNAVFLLGAYMILILEVKMDTVIEKINSSWWTILPFPNDLIASTMPQSFLHIQDCLWAIHKVKTLEWLSFAPGAFDSEEYRQLDSPLNADMHEVVPDKIVVMRSPRDLPGGALWLDECHPDGGFLHRDFSPQHYAPILEQFGVQAVVRCSAARYDRRGFEDAGIAVVDLPFEDGAAPPVDVVAKFLGLVEALPGAVAVHGGSGLGRAGTLIALYVMKHHGFTARQAVGWLRILRPGR